MFHSDWTAPFSFSAPVWGVLGVAGYFLYVLLSTSWDKGQWDKGQWDKAETKN